MKRLVLVSAPRGATKEDRDQVLAEILNCVNHPAHISVCVIPSDWTFIVMDKTPPEAENVVCGLGDPDARISDAPGIGPSVPPPPPPPPNG